jgi:8-oxo-dGTP pyrophosphatase MutT (NUDIX family)
MKNINYCKLNDISFNYNDIRVNNQPSFSNNFSNDVSNNFTKYYKLNKNIQLSTIPVIIKDINYQSNSDNKINKEYKLRNNNLITYTNETINETINESIIEQKKIIRDLTNIFCNNCGKSGHLFHQCKHPITSNGIVLFRNNNNKIEYLMVCRKNSLGFVDLMSGKYPICNKHYLMNIIDEMTINEKNMIELYDFDELWKKLWGKTLNYYHKFEEKLAKDKFNSLKEGVIFNNYSYSLNSLINESTTSWEEPEWGFPKGRRNNFEKDLICALREFEEETGYNKININIIQNIYPFEEIFTGSNYKSYKHKYYIALYDNIITDELPQHQYSEISSMRWVTYNDACNIIRPYNLEKKNMLYKINKLLMEYRLYK